MVSLMMVGSFPVRLYGGPGTEEMARRLAALATEMEAAGSPFLNGLARFVFVTSRSVNSLIWALLFVGIFGPGSLAGTAAIAMRSIGFMGKLIGEALEECDHKPVQALQAVGASWSSVLLKSYWPQVQPSFWSVLLFRWDINIRESAVLGLVGAGGIGMALDTAMNLFRWEQVSLILLSIFVIVLAVELMVTQIRKRVL